MNLRFPLMAVGDDGPTDDRLTWVVRLRNPLLLAQVEPRGVVGLRLHCWPHSDDPGALLKTLGQMVMFYRAEVEFARGAPEAWSHVFTPGFQAPRYLLLDNCRSDWTGVLEPGPRRLWHEVETGLVWDQDFGGVTPTARDARRVGDWYAEFVADDPYGD